MSRFDRLLRPRSIAVIGGGTWCANVIEQSRKIGFAGDLWPVHPLRDSVGGVSALPDIARLPAPPDAAFVGINRDDAIAAVRALARRGAGGAVCFASGFAEAPAETGGGRAKQAALCDAAGQMPLLGPNCYGFLNYLDGAALWPDQHGGVRVDRGVALVMQSSNVAINLTMQTRGLPLAYVITVGNQAQAGLSDLSRAVLRDERVTALGLYVEGIGDLRAFEALAVEARSLSKPIVALKPGKSGQARAASVTHTASLAGTDAGARALLRRLGIGQVGSLSALLEALKLLHVTGALRSNRIASMSSSGGEASLMADAVHGSGLALPPLDDAQTTALRAVLGPRVALSNPLDYHTHVWGDADAMAAVFTAVMRADLALGCVVLDLPRADRCDPSAWEPVIAAVARANAATGRPMAILASLNETLPEPVALKLIKMGIVPLAGLPEAVEAMAVAADLGRSRAAAPPLLVPPTPGPTRILTEAAAKTALTAYGLRIPAAARADTPEAAAEAAAQIGFPVVLKGEGIAHKTEAGAVALDLARACEVAAAAREMPCASFLVEEMIAGPAVELLVGVTTDPAHGYVLTLAAGGALTELLQDRVSLMVPSARGEIHDALNTLKIAPLLGGFRAAPPVDLDAVLDAVMAVQAYTAAAKPLDVEINPLICTPEAAIAADALIQLVDGHD